jgi:hypothetical protein
MMRRAPLPYASRRMRRLLRWFIAALYLLVSPATAATISFTVNMSEPVTVTGTPRIAINIGGLTRYATYAAGSGTSALTFSYRVQAGDFDANGITVISPLDLNGGSVMDAAGNPLADLAFTPADSSNLRVQTYTAAFTTLPITSANASAVGFSVTKAPAGATFTYAIGSSGGTGTVTGSGTIASDNTASVSGLDVSALASGTLTLSVQVSVANQGQGQPATAAATPTAGAGVLDTFAVTAAAYSVRRLRSAYAGPLLRVRRSSDNAERDIAATLAGNLDNTTLSGFCGAGSCFVSTWYDQSGNARDASQASTSLQPRIVNAGTIETDGGRSSVYFSGSSSASLRSPDALLNTSSRTLAAVCRNMSTTINIGGVLSTGNGGWGIYYDGDTGDGLAGYVVDGNGANQGNSSNTTGSNTNFVQLSAMYATANTSNTSLYLNGSLAETYTGTGVGLNNVSAPVEIGGRTFGGFPARVFNGRISEVLIFVSAITDASRQAVERDQGGYFGIAIP